MNSFNKPGFVQKKNFNKFLPKIEFFSKYDTNDADNISGKFPIFFKIL